MSALRIERVVTKGTFALDGGVADLAVHAAGEDTFLVVPHLTAPGVARVRTP